MKYFKSLLEVLGICFIGVAICELATLPEPEPCVEHEYVSWYLKTDAYNADGSRQFYSLCDECGRKQTGRP